MRCYVTVTAVVFGLIFAAHAWRMGVEPGVAGEPWFLCLTLLAGVLFAWAVWLLVKARRAGGTA